jgi:hypothetical protein
MNNAQGILHVRWLEKMKTPTRNSASLALTTGNLAEKIPPIIPSMK